MNLLVLSKSQIKSNWKVRMNHTVHYLSNIYKTSIASLQKVKLNYTCENMTLSFKEMHKLLLLKPNFFYRSCLIRFFLLEKRRKKELKNAEEIWTKYKSGTTAKSNSYSPIFPKKQIKK